jgi:3-oxoacyl-[acyl-carrier protein] reductase
MHLDLGGQRALVTGSSRGIGRAIAGVLHAEGCHVALNGRHADALASASATLLGSVMVAGDVTVAEEARRIVADAIAALDGLDIVICNVGSGRSAPPGEETPDDWQRAFAVNLWSTTNTVWAATEALAQSRGVIVCVSSICGLETIRGAPVTYSAAKAALHAYVRGVARPLGDRGIRINAVAPGNILFEGSVWSRRMATDALEVQRMLQQDVSLGRLGTPEEVANLVAYLASPLSGFATGAVWTLDGGQVHG